LAARLDAILVGLIQASARNACIGNVHFSQVAPQVRDNHANLTAAVMRDLPSWPRQQEVQVVSHQKVHSKSFHDQKLSRSKAFTAAKSLPQIKPLARPLHEPNEVGKLPRCRRFSQPNHCAQSTRRRIARPAHRALRAHKLERDSKSA
jgi:hypothetical protein